VDQTASVWLVLLVGVVAANLPFVNERLFVIGPLRQPKGLGWRLLELLVLFAAVVGLGMGLEARLGQRHPQGWEFHAVALCLFLTLAFPGFVWRYLLRRRH
jgi:hypothetical protein